MKRRERGKRFKPLLALLYIPLLAVLFSSGYAVTNPILKLVGWDRLPAVPHIASGFAGIAILVVAMAFARLLYELVSRRNPDKAIKMIDHTGMLKTAMDAMNQIAHGDFNVFVPVDKGNPHSALAESVNKMAKELSSMEQLRQDFISNVSHEIQSPLTSIGGFAALLRDGGLPEELRRHYIDIIETESKRLSKMSENLLKLSALEAAPLSMKEQRLDKQLESAILALEPQWAAKGLKFECKCKKVCACVDGELVTQAWINLIHNCVKFTPKGGRVKICLDEDADFAVVSISDTGIGISQADQIHVFERFYKADKSRDRTLGGNGLGLSLVKKIVELHGGSIKLESEVGKGTTFEVRLPIK